MSDCMTDNDDLLQHTLNFDDLLNDCDVCEPSLSHFGHPNATSSVWGNGNENMRDFLSYGLRNGYGMNDDWSLYGGVNGLSSLDGEPNILPSCSQNSSDIGNDGNWQFDLVSGMDFSHSVVEQARLHTDSTTHLWDPVQLGSHSTMSAVYDPFKSSSVLDLDGVPIGICSNSREKSPVRRSQSACSRPTFADITRKPSSPGSESPSATSLSKDGPAYESEESLASVQSRKSKVKAFRPAHARHGGYHVPLPIQPDSKYGLDEFEPPSKLERSFSCDDALSRSRSILDDDNLDVSECVDSSSEMSGSDPNPSEKSSATESSLHCNGGCSSEWFDPKRIFQNGSASRVRSESEPCETMLNNTSVR